MRIDAYNTISQIYGVSNAKKTAGTTKASETDKVEISDFGKELGIAKQAVKSSSDVREDKVAEVKARINDGTYDFSSSGLADRLLSKAEAEAEAI